MHKCIYAQPSYFDVGTGVVLRTYVLKLIISVGELLVVTNAYLQLMEIFHINIDGNNGSGMIDGAMEIASNVL